MTLARYVWEPVKTIQTFEAEFLSWRVPILVVVGTAILKFLIQFFLGREINLALADSLHNVVSAAELDQIQAIQRLSIISYGVTSFAVASAWMLSSLFLAGWILFAGSHLNLKHLLYFNALALVPIFVHSLLVLICLTGAHYSGYLSFQPSFAMSTSMEDIHRYVEFIEEHPATLLISRTGHLAEFGSAIFLVVNLVYSQRLKFPVAITGVGLCCIVFGLLEYLS